MTMSKSTGESIRSAEARLKAKYGDTEATIKTSCDNQYTLRFRLTSALGDSWGGVPYKVHVSGVSPVDVHLKEGTTNSRGLTGVVSTVQGESIDFYFSWPLVRVVHPF